MDKSRMQKLIMDNSRLAQMVEGMVGFDGLMDQSQKARAQPIP